MYLNIIFFYLIVLNNEVITANDNQIPTCTCNQIKYFFFSLILNNKVNTDLEQIILLLPKQ